MPDGAEDRKDDSDEEAKEPEAKRAKLDPEVPERKQNVEQSLE